jgi:hypothetical protein
LVGGLRRAVEVDEAIGRARGAERADERRRQLFAGREPRVEPVRKREAEQRAQQRRHDDHAGDAVALDHLREQARVEHLVGGRDRERNAVGERTEQLPHRVDERGRAAQARHFAVAPRQRGAKPHDLVL